MECFECGLFFPESTTRHGQKIAKFVFLRSVYTCIVPSPKMRARAVVAIMDVWHMESIRALTIFIVQANYINFLKGTPLKLNFLP